MPKPIFFLLLAAPFIGIVAFESTGKNLFSYAKIEEWFGQDLNNLPKTPSSQTGNEKVDFKVNPKYNKATQGPRSEEKKLYEKTSEKGLTSTKKIYEKAIEEYRKGNFIAAQKWISSALQKQTLSEEKQKLQILKEKIQLCLLLIADVSKKKKTDAKKIDQILMKNGKKYSGKIVTQTTNSLRIKISYGTITIPKSKIRKILQFSPQEYSQQLQDDFRASIAKTDLKGKRTTMKLFEKFAENNMLFLIPELVQHLERESSSALETMVEYKAKHLYQCYLWSKTMGKKQRAREYQSIIDQFSQTKAFQELKRDEESSQEETEQLARLIPDPPDVEESKSSENSSNFSLDSLMKKGNENYDRGYAHLKKSFPGMPDADEELALAKKEFKKACSYYRKAAQLSPNNEKLKSRLQEAMEFYHHCLKQTRLK